MGHGSGAQHLEALGVEPGAFLALTIHDGGATIATRLSVVDVDSVDDAIDELEARRPRWLWWGRETADTLAARRLVVDRCWDVTVVQRLLSGGWHWSLGAVWADLNGLDLALLPGLGQMDLLSGGDEGNPEAPTRPDGHLRPEWIGGSWSRSPERRRRWAELLLDAADLQTAHIRSRADSTRCASSARSESLAELLCAELEHEGLPVDVVAAERIIAAASGPRARTHREEEQQRARRDAAVLDLLDAPQEVNLRNPSEVKAMLRLAGLDLPDTRAWRLERLRDSDPLIDALLRWRKDERIATTYGWNWLDDHVQGGRLRGSWASSDGAAGRMTASSGLHNLPAPMRPAVAADAGHRLVRADLGQIEPRILAAVSGDRGLIDATRSDDLYQPVAEQLRVGREIAKVAVLGAMYGATTGESAGALQGLRRNYPTAMTMLEEAAESGRLGHDITTFGGRRVRMGGGAAPDGDIDRARAAAAGRGRYARNALIQGAAAEFFKVWAVLVRRRVRPIGGVVVLCLHDELLVHVPTANAEAAARVVVDAIGEAAHHWSPEPNVRFVADVSIIERWSDAKG